DVHTRGGRGAGDAVDARGQDDRGHLRGREAVRDRGAADAAERLVDDPVAVPVELVGVDRARRGPAAGREGEGQRLVDGADRRAGQAGDREDGDGGLPREGGGVRVGRGHGLGARRPQGGVEVLHSAVSGREGVVGRQRGGRVGAAEVHRARVVGGLV